ncbi:MAG: class I SAM-dependent methyltransferase [Armatimonadetes bacterium]|nr:class I SAM-dependent methyltransferase [Armatimonadota bacterium]
MNTTLERQEKFSTVTELPGMGASPEAIKMLATRYAFAANLGKGKDVLEVAHGPGIGLGHLRRHSKSLVCGDYDQDMVDAANSHYSDISQKMDAQDLRFDNESFDVVLLLEAIYFVPEGKKAVEEAVRVLRPGGKFMIASANPLFFSFNAAPYSTSYFSPLEYQAIFAENGMTCETLCGFPEERGGLKSKVISVVRKLAVTFKLIPDTMEGKERIKRLLYGELPPFPKEIDPSTMELETFVPTASVSDLSKYKVIYAIGTKNSS